MPTKRLDDVQRELEREDGDAADAAQAGDHGSENEGTVMTGAILRRSKSEEEMSLLPSHLASMEDELQRFHLAKRLGVSWLWKPSSHPAQHLASFGSTDLPDCPNTFLGSVTLPPAMIVGGDIPRVPMMPWSEKREIMEAKLALQEILVAGIVTAKPKPLQINKVDNSRKCPNIGVAQKDPKLLRKKTESFIRERATFKIRETAYSKMIDEQMKRTGIGMSMRKLEANMAAKKAQDDVRKQMFQDLKQRLDKEYQRAQSEVMKEDQKPAPVNAWSNGRVWREDDSMQTSWKTILEWIDALPSDPSVFMSDWEALFGVKRKGGD